MRVSQLVDILQTHKSALVRFQLPDGSLVAPHAHVTEVGRVTKVFVDCGGITRSEDKCLLQTWVADDLDHRLSAYTMLSIIEKGRSILGAEDLPVELEHDIGYATQFQLIEAAIIGAEIILRAAGRHTACLAPDKCCPPIGPASLISLARQQKDPL